MVIDQVANELFESENLRQTLDSLQSAVINLRNNNDDSKQTITPIILAIDHENPRATVTVPLSDIVISRYDDETTLREKLVASLFDQGEEMAEAVKITGDALKNAGTPEGCAGFKKVRAAFATGTLTMSVCTNPELIEAQDGSPIPVVTTVK